MKERSRIAQNMMLALLGGLPAASIVAGCASHRPKPAPLERPVVAPTSAENRGEPLRLDASQIEPMYTEVIAIDLPTVLKVATAKNVDIRQARLAVEAARGQVESAIGGAFPVIAPTALFDHVDGTVRATEGNLVRVAFNTFQPSIGVQWIINPGRVIYEIAAAKKRLSASKDQRDAVVIETLRIAAIQFYQQVLTQSHVSAAHRGVTEAEELLRISRLRVRTGTGVAADELRAAARLAQRRQELVAARNGFYNASVALAVTLRMDASVTLVPGIDELPPIHLVREDIPIDDLLGIATAFRPDLESVRKLVDVAHAKTGATWWGRFGPQFEAKYSYGGITGHTDNFEPAEGIPNNLIVNPRSSSGSFSPNPVVNGLIREGISRESRRFGHRPDQTFGFSDQQRFSAGVGWRLTLAAFGDLKTAKAVEMQAVVDAERKLDQVRADVVQAAQNSRANHELIDLAHQQVTSAEEALRLTEANLRAGTMTTLDVLQAQDAATQARLRYAQAVVRFNQSQVNLLAALGLLNIDTLAAGASPAESVGS